MNKIDARGLSCPAPVLETKAALSEHRPSHIEVVVDNEPASQNVVRFLESRGYVSKVEQTAELYTVVGACGETFSEPETVSVQPEPDDQKIMVMVAADRVGSGDDVLGAKLMVNFIKTLKEMGDDLWRLVFVNSGVKLTIDDADTLEDLKDFEEAGLTILVCGTCLDHFGLIERKKVGVTTNMLDIVTAMQLADKVINI